MRKKLRPKSLLPAESLVGCPADPRWTAGGVIGGIVSSVANTAMVPKLAAPVIPKRVRVSQGVTKGMLVTRSSQGIRPSRLELAYKARLC